MGTFGPYGAPENPSPLSLIQQGVAGIGQAAQTYKDENAEYHPLVQQVAAMFKRRVAEGVPVEQAKSDAQQMMESLVRGQGLAAPQGQSLAAPAASGPTALAPGGPAEQPQAPQPQSLGDLTNTASAGLNSYMQGGSARPVQQPQQSGPPPQSLGDVGPMQGGPAQVMSQAPAQVPSPMQQPQQQPSTMPPAAPQTSPGEQRRMNKPMNARDIQALNAMTPYMQMFTKSDFEKQKNEDKMLAEAAKLELKKEMAATRHDDKMEIAGKKFDIESRKLNATEQRDAANVMVKLMQIKARADAVRQQVGAHLSVAGSKNKVDNTAMKEETKRMALQVRLEVAKLNAEANLAGRTIAGTLAGSSVRSVQDAQDYTKSSLEETSSLLTELEAKIADSIEPMKEEAAKVVPDVAALPAPASVTPSTATPKLEDTAKKTTQQSNKVTSNAKLPTTNIKVRRKSDGKTGSMPASSFDPAKYERVQ